VDELHLTEKEQLIAVEIILTSLHKGVKQTRSLTVSEVFRLVASPGPKQVHRSRPPWRAAINGGTVTVNSEPLVEKTRDKSKTR
jgi:hypothetical protein